MATTSSGGRRRTRVRSTARVVATGVVAVLLAACSNTTASSGSSSADNADSGDMITADSVDQDALAATIKKALFADVPVSDLDPVMANAMAVASQPLTDEQNALLETCMQQASCDTGHGTLTVGINADAANNPWWNIRRAEATAQAIAYPQVKKIIYTASSSGDIAEVLANLRSLIAQQVDIIVDNPDFGPAILPVIQQAKDAGIAFVTANAPLPNDSTDLTATQIPFDLCAMGKAAAEQLDKTVTNKTYGLYTGIPGNAIAASWHPCAEKALDGLGWQKVTTGFTQWTPQGSSQAANALIASGKDVGAILNDDYMDEFYKAYMGAGETPPATFNDAPRFSSFGVEDDLEAAGLDANTLVANGHVWYGRPAVTAGVMIKSGMDVKPKVVPPVPVVPIADTADQNVPGVPAQGVIGTLLTVEQMNMALASS
jgi:ABC-type sugar transport system substrate-binding protein